MDNETRAFIQHFMCYDVPGTKCFESLIVICCMSGAHCCIYMQANFTHKVHLTKNNYLSTYMYCT